MNIEEVLAIRSHLIGDKTVQAVDARALHHALEVRRDFTNWIKGKVQDCGLIEGIHWAKVVPTAEMVEIHHAKFGEHRFLPTDYTLTLDAAKLIAMSSRGEPARLVREYFLECERVVSQYTQATLPGSREEAIRNWSNNTEAYARAMLSVGYSQAEVRRQSLVEGYTIQQQTGYTVLPVQMLEDSEAHAARALVLPRTAGVTAALVSKGINALNVSQIAKEYPEVTTTIINKLLVSMGMQVQISKSTFAPTPESEEFAVTATVAKGPNEGEKRVTGWNWNDVRFRGPVGDRLHVISMALQEQKRNPPEDRAPLK